jgi:hypothetical protein
MANTDVVVSGTIYPATTNGIAGTTLGDNAVSGSVGEYIEKSIAPVVMPNSTPTSLGGYTFPAGDWDIWGSVYTNSAAGITETRIVTGLSLNTSLPSVPNIAEITGISSVNIGQSLSAPMLRFNFSTPTNVYLVGFVSFTGSGSETMGGVIRARRVR